MKEQKVEKWYDSGHNITSLIITTILVIIICSQSYAVGESSSLALFGSVINHNSIYLLVLIYFILVKFPFGKKYFNYLSVFLIFIYFFATLTSLLTVVQSFGLNTVLSFTLNFVLFIYLVHTLFRDTRIWKEFSLNNSPFNELSNEWFFYAIIVLSVFLLAVNLISTVVIGGVVISCLDMIYVVLLGRYIYLYREYLDKKKIDANNKGNFDEVREVVSSKVQEVLDKTDIDEKVIELKDKVVDFVEEKEIDKKIEEVKDKVVDTSKEIIKEVEDFIEERELDIKVSKEKEEKKEVKKKTTTKKKTTKKDSKKKGDKE